MDEFTKVYREQEVIEAALAWWSSSPKLKTVDDRVLYSTCERYISNLST